MRKLPALSEKIAADPARAMRAAGFDPEAARYELRDSDGRSAVRGLGMVVQKSGHRTWVLRYEIAGRPYKLTLGPYTSELKLAAARDIASKRKLEIANGQNPAADKAEARRKTGPKPGARPPLVSIWMHCSQPRGTNGRKRPSQKHAIKRAGEHRRRTAYGNSTWMSLNRDGASIG
jgi:hypothetical protein